MAGVSESEIESCLSFGQLLQTKQEIKNAKEKIRPRFVVGKTLEMIFLVYSLLVIRNEQCNFSLSSSTSRNGETKRKKSLVKFAVQNIFWGQSLEEKTSAGGYICMLQQTLVAQGGRGEEDAPFYSNSFPFTFFQSNHLPLKGLIVGFFC
jgi:hypothetical protein